MIKAHSVYFWIPVGELTNDILFKSTSDSVTDFPIQVSNTIPFYLVEVLNTNIDSTFDGYQRFYSKSQVDEAIPFVRSAKTRIEGIISSVTQLNSITMLSYTLIEDRIIESIQVCVKNSTFGDSIDIVIYNGATSTPLLAPVNGFYVSDTILTVPTIKSLIKAGIQIRLIYHSVSQSQQAQVYMNMFWKTP